MNSVSLFAGVGGFDLAMQRCGIDVVASVEIDKHASKVLAARFPNTHLFNDVSEVTGEQLRAVGFDPNNGIITGGFPCQDLSIAGARRGLAGDRSGLFWQIIRLADELRPKWLVLENVPGLLSSNGGKDMGIVIGELEQRGYGVCWRVLDAQHFGVAQRRRRLFIVCCLADHRRPVEILFEPESGIRHPAPRQKTKYQPSSAPSRSIGFSHTQGLNMQAREEQTPTLRREGGGMAVLMRQREGKDGGGKGPLLSDKSLTLATANDQTLFVSPTLTSYNLDSRSPQSSEQTNIVNAVHSITSTVRRLTPKECERLQGFPDDWTAGQTDGHRYKQMGNAVAVPVVQWIVDRLVNVESNE
jgi:DNA (cytosine-5)-methyltransferase 1